VHFFFQARKNYFAEKLKRVAKPQTAHLTTTSFKSITTTTSNAIKKQQLHIKQRLQKHYSQPAFKSVTLPKNTFKTTTSTAALATAMITTLSTI
jgi:hypothetical protein